MLLRIALAAILSGSLLCAHAHETLPVVAITPDVYVILGSESEATAENLGRVVNIGFIVGADSVIVIDSGANQRHGEAIISTIQSTTDKPIRLLINTHPNPNYVLGNKAFAQRGIPILSSAATAAAMLERCPRCIEDLGNRIGKEAMKDTQITQPQERIGNSHTIEIGGRNIALLHFGHARTEGDLAVLDETSGVLFAGDLVYRDRIHHFAEASFRGWIAALDQLAKYPVRVLVPGHGAIGDQASLARMRDYLRQLYDAVSLAYREGQNPDEALTSAELPEFADWPGYARNHPLNVQRAYFELEADEFARMAGRN